jgi:hypothetical protein
LLSILLLLRQFRTMLLGQRLKIHTDHKNLTCDNYNSIQMLRWRLDFEEFGPRIQYIKGANNVVVDALSRLPRTDNESTDLEKRANHPHSQVQAAAVRARELIDLEAIATKQKDDSGCNDGKITAERERSVE